jgi:CRP-like cAMP-binding protein
VSQTIAPLPAFDGDDLDQLRRMGREVSFEPGEVIFEAGDRADAMFVVLEGEAQVDVGGRFHRLRHGDVFGEMALLGPSDVWRPRGPWSRCER